jgi:hypothetical protein
MTLIERLRESVMEAEENGNKTGIYDQQLMTKAADALEACERALNWGLELDDPQGTWHAAFRATATAALAKLRGEP